MIKHKTALMLAGAPLHGDECLPTQKKHIIDRFENIDVYVVTNTMFGTYFYNSELADNLISPKAFLKWEDSDLELPEVYKDISNAKDEGDPRPVPCSQRCIRELFGIYQGFKLIEMSEIEYGLVIRCRIDMFIEEDFPELEEITDALYLPAETCNKATALYGRFAYGNMKTMKHYTDRYKTIREYERQGLDTWERELKYTMDLLKIKVEYKPQKMKRFGKAN